VGSKRVSTQSDRVPVGKVRMGEVRIKKEELGSRIRLRQATARQGGKAGALRNAECGVRSVGEKIKKEELGRRKRRQPVR
jgi:hypothetical protein